MVTNRTRIVILGAAVALLIAACGGDSGEAALGTTASTSASDSSDASGDTAAPAEDTVASDDTEANAGSSQTPSGGGDLSLVPAGETDILGNPAGQGFVELDGVRYDFILNGACQKIFGAVQAAGSAADGSDVSVDSIIPPEDWESDTKAEYGFDPPSVSIDIGDDSWQAEVGSEHFAGGENVVLTPEESAVTSFTNDGSRVTGNAIFYSTYNFDDVETVTGSFEFYCP